jgi:hypothetical protein
LSLSYFSNRCHVDPQAFLGSNLPIYASLIAGMTGVPDLSFEYRPGTRQSNRSSN